jgi:hypothetical protein
MCPLPGKAHALHEFGNLQVSKQTLTMTGPVLYLRRYARTGLQHYWRRRETRISVLTASAVYLDRYYRLRSVRAYLRVLERIYSGPLHLDSVQKAIHYS